MTEGKVQDGYLFLVKRKRRRKTTRQELADREERKVS